VLSAHCRLQARLGITEHGGIVVREFYDNQYGTVFRQLVSMIEGGVAEFDTVLVHSVGGPLYGSRSQFAGPLRRLGIEAITFWQRPEVPRGCAIYMRMATKRQAEQLSDQRVRLRDFVERHGGVVVDQFTDTVGTSRNRPGLRRLEAIVESGVAGFQTVLVHSFSRFFRSAREGGDFVEKLRKRGIEIVSITQPVPAGPAGDLMRVILMSVDLSHSVNRVRRSYHPR
jgi:hypothetical protein